MVEVIEKEDGPAVPRKKIEEASDSTYILYGFILILAWITYPFSLLVLLRFASL